MTEEPKKERDNQQKQKKLPKQAAAAQLDEEDEDEVPEVESRIQVPQKGAKGNEQKPRAQPRQTEVQPRQQAEVQPRQTQAQQKVAGRPSETLSRGQPQSQLRVAGSPSETLSKVQPQAQPRVAGSPSETLARGQPQPQPRPETRKTQQQQQQQQQKRRQQALQQQDEEDEDDDDNYPSKDSKPFRIRVKKCSDFKRDPNFEVVRKRLKDDKNKALKTLVDSVVQSPPDLCMALSVNSDMDNVSFHKDRFEVIVDAEISDADDIVCVVKGQEIEISAEKKSSSCSGAVTGRLMKRMYSLPQPINPEYSTCFLSKDGLLVLSAPWNS